MTDCASTMINGNRWILTSMSRIFFLGNVIAFLSLFAGKSINEMMLRDSSVLFIMVSVNLPAQIWNQNLTWTFNTACRFTRFSWVRWQHSPYSSMVKRIRAMQGHLRKYRSGFHKMGLVVHRMETSRRESTSDGRIFKSFLQLSVLYYRIEARDTFLFCIDRTVTTATLGIRKRQLFLKCVQDAHIDL